jgi:hypothetical protein
LYEALSERLAGRRELGLWSRGAFLDLLWDDDLHLEEIEALDGVVTIDATDRPRRMIAQSVRGRLRYWLATDRDPIALSSIAEAGRRPCVDATMRQIYFREGASARSTSLRGLRLRRSSGDRGASR